MLFDKLGLAAGLLLLLLLPPVRLLAGAGSAAFLAAVEALALGLWELCIGTVTRAMGAAAIRALGLTLTSAGWLGYSWRELGYGLRLRISTWMDIGFWKHKYELVKHRKNKEKTRKHMQHMQCKPTANTRTNTLPPECKSDYTCIV